MSNPATEQDDGTVGRESQPNVEFIYVDDDTEDTGDSEFEPHEGGQDDDSIAPEEDVTDEEEVDGLMRESEMSLSDLLASYGLPASSLPTGYTGGGSAPSPTTSNDRRVTRKRRHDGSAVHAEPNPTSAETTAATATATTSNSNNNGTVHPAGDSIEIDLTLSNEEGEASNPAADDVGMLVIDTDVDEDEDPDVVNDDDEDDEEEDDEEEGDEDVGPDDKNHAVSLWCQAIAGGESPSYDSAEDEDYQPNVEGAGNWRGEMHVGEEYQAIVPPGPPSVNTRTDSHLGAEADLLWFPRRLSESETERYELAYAQVISLVAPNVATPDDEEALFFLMRANYDSDEALSRLRHRPFNPHEVRPFLETWSEAECVNFEKGFANYNKNFFLIQRNKLPDRTVKDLVNFYYFWKKTARHDEFIRHLRREKKKPSHPGITDFMDCLMKEQLSTVSGAAPDDTTGLGLGTDRRNPSQMSSASPKGDASTTSSHSAIAISSTADSDEARSQQGTASPTSSTNAVPNAAEN
ncbi:hypothetical protein Aperf_G00000120350 [Anoplocephala perfoliata]